MDAPAPVSDKSHAPWFPGARGDACAPVEAKKRKPTKAQRDHFAEMAFGAMLCGLGRRRERERETRDARPAVDVLRDGGVR
mgnify:FL=1